MILAVALVYTAIEAQPRRAGNDVPMALAVEQFVRDAGTCDFEVAADAVFDYPDRETLRRLGARKWQDRDATARSMRARVDAGALRLAAWAAMSPDAEVALRGEAALDDLWRCRQCRGMGLCTGCHGQGGPFTEADGSVWAQCPRCNWFRNGVWLCSGCRGSGDAHR